jgi:hypothetical protein
MNAKIERPQLSPSSFSEFQACNRKYYYRKIKKLPFDSDYEDDQTVFNVGKAFHKACEDSLHDVSKVSRDHLYGILQLYELDVQEWYPMIKVMLDTYGVVHSQSKLEVVACEHEVESPFFYGIVDVILQDSKGWWIGDLKTASSFVTSQLPTLLSHPQLNLYAAHAPTIAKRLDLDVSKFKGCRYRVTTKSKVQRKPLELEESYMKRLQGSIRAFDVVLPIERMIHRRVYESYKSAFIEIQKGEQGSYPQNFSNCFAYYRPCPYWSQCNGREFSQTGGLEVLSSHGS